MQPASVPLVETIFDEPVMIFICRYRAVDTNGDDLCKGRERSVVQPQVMTLGRADESECDTPCNGHDGSDGGEAIMCGGTWRNSIYESHTNNWEAAGYDDTNVK